MLNKILKSVVPASIRCANSRLYTSNSQYFNVIRDRHTKDYVTLNLNRAPVNSLDLDTLNDLSHQLDIFNEDPVLKGVILSSDISNVFSSGLDLKEFYQSEPHRLEKLWIATQNVWLKLYGSNKIVIAAVNGHAIALGCLVMMACDYRIMASEEKFKTGISAVNLGITPPSWLKDTMCNTIGQRQTEISLELGKTYSPQEALDIKLVDEIVPQKDVLKAAEDQMKIWCKIPSEARDLTKKLMRKNTIDKFMLNRETDLEEFVNLISNQHVQTELKNYLTSLTDKHKYL